MNRAARIELLRALVLGAAALAQNGSSVANDEVRTIAAREIPVPSHVSPELQAWIGRHAQNKPWSVPHSEDEWRVWAKGDPRAIHEAITARARKFHVTISAEHIASVATHVVMPAEISHRNQNRLVMHLHYGGYVSGAGEAGLHDAILLAHYTGIKVVAVDYRLPPDHPFPAALDDAVAVWRQLARTTKPSHAAIAGSSAGGGLALAVVRQLIARHLPVPGAILASTPWTDLTVSGDTAMTHGGIDGALSGARAFLLAAGKLYAGKHDVRNPLISPVNADFTAFPPTILVTGTRDLFLSDTVRVHRKLREAGAQAELHVFEAMSHGDYIWSDAPESQEAYREVTAFFDSHLAH